MLHEVSVSCPFSKHIPIHFDTHKVVNDNSLQQNANDVFYALKVVSEGNSEILIAVSKNVQVINVSVDIGMWYSL